MAGMDEHEKVKRVQANAALIRDFLSHVEKEHELELCREEPAMGDEEAGWFPYNGSLTNLLHEFFGIDIEKLAAETAAITERNRQSEERIAATREKVGPLAESLPGNR